MLCQISFLENLQSKINQETMQYMENSGKKRKRREVAAEKQVSGFIAAFSGVRIPSPAPFYNLSLIVPYSVKINKNLGLLLKILTGGILFFCLKPKKGKEVDLGVFGIVFLLFCTFSNGHDNCGGYYD